jgi:5-methyltetrahydrofolate--homocysteine methyltransferase
VEKLKEFMIAVEEEPTLDEVRRLLSEGAEPLDLVEALREAMSAIGERFEKKEYFLSELIMSAEVFNQAMELIVPRLEAGGTGEKKGKVVIGTVQGDIHYIGKNIVVSLLRCEGYDVYDLGEDVKPEAFVQKLEETGARILGLSALLTVAFESMKETIDRVEEAGLREQVKIMIGGAPVDEAVVDYCGADAYGKDATEAVRLANSYQQ